jgi:hypothetical protein
VLHKYTVATIVRLLMKRVFIRIDAMVKQGEWPLLFGLMSK